MIRKKVKQVEVKAVKKLVDITKELKKEQPKNLWVGIKPKRKRPVAIESPTEEVESEDGSERMPGSGPFTGPGTGPNTGPGTAPGTGPGTDLMKPDFDQKK
ncbi:hypothetical protein [Effusibacillus consociatus]|uniref:Uncharacterized protein n=1 Tax=Effusibacillus consociatus TaxID=1117041 RepID=A0ABV9PVL0_9BACL